MIYGFVQYDGSKDDLDWRIDFKYLNLISINLTHHQLQLPFGFLYFFSFDF